MCGRFVLFLDSDELSEDFGLNSIPADFAPRYNIAPTMNVLAVRDVTTRAGEWLRWGLIPSWARDPSVSGRMINARSETLLEKPSFRTAAQRRRCLILANGFFEWQRSGKSGPSTPYFFRLKDQRPFAFAGLWETWRNPKGNDLHTCTIITTSANEVVAPIHERMPVMLPLERCYEWIQPGPAEAVLHLLRPIDPALMETYRVSKLVNRPGADGAQIVQPIP